MTHEFFEYIGKGKKVELGTYFTDRVKRDAFKSIEEKPVSNFSFEFDFKFADRIMCITSTGLPRIKPTSILLADMPIETKLPTNE